MQTVVTLRPNARENIVGCLCCTKNGGMAEWSEGGGRETGRSTVVEGKEENPVIM
jgi:hypothetical protein